MLASAQGTSDRLMGRALLASLAIHALVIAFIPALARTPASGVPVETVTFTPITRIEIEPRRRPHPQPRAAAPRRSSLPVVSEATRIELARTTPRREVFKPPSVPARLSSAPHVAAVQQVGSGTAATVADPQATASPVPPAVSSTVRRDRGGYLPFGAEQPDPVLDPGVQRQLASLGVHVTLLVTVGNDGKTKSVAFRPALDLQTETHIESLLADADWDPAVCGGGISCEGTATIKL